MCKVNIKVLNFHLLESLQFLLEEKHVSRAAEKMGISQPMMSRALARLRHIFHDPLLAKTVTGLCLTPRAEKLLSPVEDILNQAKQLVSPVSFEPTTLKREIVIATRDYETTVIFPHIVNTVSNLAPQLSFRVLPLTGDDLAPLERNEADFVIAGSNSTASTLSRYTLFQENFVCLLSCRNQIPQKQWTMERYLSMKHCAVTIRNSGHGLIDNYLAAKNLQRHIAVRVPHFLAATQIAAQSELVMTLPRRLGETLVSQKNLKILPLPFEIADFPIYLYWHIRYQKDSVNQWLRKIILKLSA